MKKHTKKTTPKHLNFNTNPSIHNTYIGLREITLGCVAGWWNYDKGRLHMVVVCQMCVCVCERERERERESFVAYDRLRLHHAYVTCGDGGS